MKKFIYSFFALLCVVSFTACSDDDDNVADKLSKTYEGENLKVNGEESSTIGVQFSTSDLETGNVTINNFLPGEEKISLTVTMSENTANTEVYSFEGSSKNDNREVSVKGKVSRSDGMEIDLTTKITSPIVGNWKPIQGEPYTIQLDITPGTITTIKDMGGEEIPLVSEDGDKTVSLVQSIGTMSDLLFSLIVNFELEMKNNGNLVAKWAPGVFAGGSFEKGESKDGIVKYNVVDNQVVVLISIADLIGGESSRADINISDLLPLMTLISKGLVFNLDFKDKNLAASVTREMMLPYLPIIASIVPKLIEGVDFTDIAGGMLDITPEGLTQFLKDIIEIIEDSEKFDLIINMKPAA